MRRFHKLCFATLIALYVLIAVGSIVRTTGSGMGCPDWPRCFGKFIPPTSIEQLPSDYKDRYASIREKKNVRFAKYLDAFGFDDTANKLVSDKSILKEEDFNPVKTWIEYVNRLVGVVIGILIILLVWRSFPIRKVDPLIFGLSIGTLVLVIFQGWFGSIVVSTNLTTWTITIHMFLAVVMVVMLAFLQHRSDQGSRPIVADNGMIVLIVVAMVLLIAQVYLGTEVRAAIDRLAGQMPRSGWISNLGQVFITHRTFSWIILVIHAAMILKIRKTVGRNPLSIVLIILILGTFLTGVGMAYFDVPAVLQPLHLLMATMAIGTEALLLFKSVAGKSKTVQIA